ncbi:MAG: TonB-dependent receptor, partial [Crocinitomicaceae bacterium]
HNRIYVEYLQDDGRNIGYPALTMDVAFANAKIGSLSHVYENKAKKLFRWETKVYMNYIDHAMDDTKRPAALVPMHMDMPGNSMTSGFYSGGSIRIAKQNFLYLKVDGYQNDLHAEMTMYPKTGNKMFMLTIPDARRSDLGLNISDKHYFRKGSSLSFGGRLEYVHSEITTLIGRQTMTSNYIGNPDKNKLIYNVFIRYEQKLKKNFTLFMNVSNSLRHATLQEMYGFYLYNRVDAHDYLGNPDLKPEASLNFNLGVKTEHKKWNASFQFFTYQFSNYITGVRLNGYSVMTIGGSGVKSYTNLSSANISGGEYSLQWKLIDKLLIQTTGSISIGQDVTGAALPFIPPFRSVSKIQYDLKGYFFKLEYITAAAQKRVSSEKYGEKTTPNFHVFNIGISKQFTFAKNYLQCSLNLDNVFNASYYEHLDVMKVHRQGRNLTIRVTLVF